MLQAKKINQSNRFWIMIIFMINPFLTLLIAFKFYLSNYSKNIVWFFCGFYGFTFFPVRSTMDAFRHREDFLSWAAQTHLTFAEFTQKLYSEDVNSIDIFMPLLKFLISRVTANPNIFYGILGLLFGYFFSRNIWFLLSYNKKRINKYQVLFIFAFALIVAPWEINSFRFWIAAHIFVYYAFRVLIQKKRVYIIGLLVTPFIHFAFIFTIAIFLGYLVMGKRLYVCYAMLLGSLLINGIDVGAIQNIIPKTSIELLDKRTNNYTDEGYIDARATGAENIKWYVTIRYPLIYFFTFFIAFVLFFKKRKEMLASNLLSYLCFTLLLMAVSYAVMNIVPTFFRYFRLSLLMFYGFLFLFFLNRENKWYRRLFLPHLAIILFFAAIEVRVWFDTATIDTLTSNPITIFFYQTNQPIVDFLK